MSAEFQGHALQDGRAFFSRPARIIRKDPLEQSPALSVTDLPDASSFKLASRSPAAYAVFYSNLETSALIGRGRAAFCLGPAHPLPSGGRRITVPRSEG